VRNLRVWWAKHCQFYEHFISFQKHSHLRLLD
jgi:hypothetical protein